MSKLQHYTKELRRLDFSNFARLTSCDVPDSVLTIITDHLHRMVEDVMQRYLELSAKDFQDWLTYLSLVDRGDVDPFVRDELTDLDIDASVAIIHRVKRQLMWLNDEFQEKYSWLAGKAVKLFLSFPSTYLADCVLSTVSDVLTKKRCSLDIVDRSTIYI